MGGKDGPCGEPNSRASEATSTDTWVLKYDNFRFVTFWNLMLTGIVSGGSGGGVLCSLSAPHRCQRTNR
jgi:hypothetical protein